MNKRIVHNLIAALLTFALGVFIATLSGRILSGFAHLLGLQSTTEQKADLLKDSPCNKWENTTWVSDGFGWDLTYMSLLVRSGVCPGDLYCEIAPAKPQPPVNKHFAEWQGEPIVSSILIELPDGHADMRGLWLVRTTNQAYWWTFHPHHSNPTGVQPLPAQHYDLVFEAMTCWQQQDPWNRKFFNEEGEGYVGFLSLYKEGKSRQMLLSSPDLFEVWPNGSDWPDDMKWGRLFKTLKPIYLDIIEQEKQAAQVSK